MQQMKPNIVVFDGRIEFDRNGDQAEEEDATGDGTSHLNRLSGVIFARQAHERLE